MAERLGSQRLATLGRELTKTFETIRHGTLDELAEWVRQDPNQQKGEFVLAVAGHSTPVDTGLSQEQKALASLLNNELPPKKAAKLAAAHHHGNAKAIYQWLINRDTSG